MCLGAELLPVNPTRAQKAPIVQGGIAAADPSIIPAGYERGGAAYLNRFAEAMAGHATPEQVARYFDAQSLTDDVMAVHLLEGTQARLRFLVTGSFHADYDDGVVARLRARAPTLAQRTIRFVDCSDYTEAELKALKRHAAYGPVADYVYYVNEPTDPER